MFSLGNVTGEKTCLKLLNFTVQQLNNNNNNNSLFAVNQSTVVAKNKLGMDLATLY
jgi:hypothetical protein